MVEKLEMGFERDDERREWYWVRSGERGGVGIVAAFGWMFSNRHHLVPYTRLYAASGCDSLVCHPDVFNLWFPSRAEALAIQILDELAKEVEGNPRPIVFATFSGGAKACLYKILQILQSTEVEGSPCAGKYQSVKDCVRGQIHDSSPIDFVSSSGARFVSYSISQMLGMPNAVLSAMTQLGAKILDALFLPKFELQRADYWLTLEKSSKLGPILILCSTNDDLAPFDNINKFAMRVRELGHEVDIVAWDTSNHVAHLRNFPKEYHDAVKPFLDQRLLHHIQTPRAGIPVGSDKLTYLQRENPERGSAIKRPLHLCRSSSNTQVINSLDASRTTDMIVPPNVVSSQDTSGPMRNLLLKSKL